MKGCGGMSVDFLVQIILLNIYHHDKMCLGIQAVPNIESEIFIKLKMI